MYDTVVVGSCSDACGLVAMVWRQCCFGDSVASCTQTIRTRSPNRGHSFRAISNAEGWTRWRERLAVLRRETGESRTQAENGSQEAMAGSDSNPSKRSRKDTDGGQDDGDSKSKKPLILPQPKVPYQEGYCFYVVWDTLGMCSSKSGAASLDMSSGLTLAEIIDFRLLPEEAKKLGAATNIVSTTATSLAASTSTRGDGDQDSDAEEPERPEMEPHLFEYYLHYVDFDRRLDAWVSYNELVDLESSEGRQATAARKAEKKDIPNPLTRKRDHSHGGMNETVAAFEREHEELTKVKNLNTVELGSYRMEAWYYSPYPEKYVCAEYCCVNSLDICHCEMLLLRWVCTRGCDLAGTQPRSICTYADTA